MTRMTGPDCVVMCNLINTHTHTHTHTQHLAHAVEWKKNKYWGSFTATYSLLPIAMSTSGDVGSDVHALIKELAIRRVQHRLDILQRVPTSGRRDRSSTSSAAILFCFTAGTFIPHVSPSLQTGGGACEHPTAPFPRPGVCTSASYRGVTESEGQEGAIGVGGRIGVGGGSGDGNGDVNGRGDGDGVGTGTGTGVEVNEGAQDGNGDGNGDGVGTGTWTGMGTRRRTPDGNGDGNGDGSEDSSGDGDGDDDNGNRNENRIGEGGREAKKRKKPQNSCRRRAGNGGDTGGKIKNVEKKVLVQ